MINVEDTHICQYYVYRFERTLDKFSLAVYSLRFNKNSLTHFPRLTLIYIAQCKIIATPALLLTSIFVLSIPDRCKYIYNNYGPGTIRLV